MHSNNLRRIFANQNGQCLIVDIADMNIEFINNLIKVLQDILTVGCSVRGGIRIPAFSLSILTRINIIKYEFDVIRGNFNKIQAALNSIVQFCQINEEISLQEYKDGIYSAINSVLRTFIFKQTNCDSINNIQHIGITLITVKDCQTVRSYIDSLILDLEGLSKIEKISIIELQNFGNQITENKCGLTETIKMNGSDLTQIQKYFKRWLLDESSGTDLILHLPESQNTTLSIKCDIFECVINPISLPFGHRVYLQTDNLNTQMLGLSSAKTANHPYVPIYELNILSRLSCNAICESTLFGLPLCLRPTRSWKLPLNEDKTNQEYFSELCKQLADNDEFLFAQMRTHFQTDQFMPYFVLTPGDSCLLIKSFASSDLILPWKEENLQSGTLENKSRICNALHNLKYENDLDPYNYESGLYSALRANLKHARRETNFDLTATSSTCTSTNNINKRSKRTKQ